ncbi:MAG: hypothetical protein AB1Z20_24050, partial [Desulfobacterales bacterium]
MTNREDFCINLIYFFGKATLKRRLVDSGNRFREDITCPPGKTEYTTDLMIKVLGCVIGRRRIT